MKIIVAISGASGAIYGVKTLQELNKKGIETHLIISRWGSYTIEKETTFTVKKVKEMATYAYLAGNLAAPIASGTCRWDGMAVVPCSMKTLAGIANGYAEDLITRAADVTIKEKRKLVLLVRETPLNAIHLENMLKLARLGVVIMPPVPAFYSEQLNLDDIVGHTVGRLLEQFGVQCNNLKRWQG